MGLYLETQSRGRGYGQVLVNSLRLGAVSSNKHEARVNIDVELFFIARKESVFDPFDAVPPKSRR